MSLKNFALFRKDIGNTLESDVINFSIQNNAELKQNLQSHTIQLSAEQAIQLGLKFYDDPENISDSTPPTVTPVSNSHQYQNLVDDLHKVNRNLEPNSMSLLARPMENKNNLTRRTQMKAISNVSVEDINELLSFNNDEEGTVFLQNNALEQYVAAKNVITQVHHKLPGNKQIVQTIDPNLPNTSKLIKYRPVNSINAIKPFSAQQPTSHSNDITLNNQSTLPNLQKKSLQSLLNKSSLETKSLMSTNTDRPISVVPIKKQNRVKSILFKPAVPSSNNNILTNNIMLQARKEKANALVFNNNHSYSILNQLSNNNNNDTRATVIRNENDSILSQMAQKLSSKNAEPAISGPASYKVEYRLDLMDKDDSNIITTPNLTYTINLANDNSKENDVETIDNTNVETENVFEEDIDEELLNKTISSTSKIENSIMPLLSSARSIEASHSETNAVQEALQRYPVNINKPLGSTDNPIKLMQKGQTFHSLQSLDESQLQQIAGALKHRPPYQQQSGDREPHKVILYDSATHTRIIYRIVYPEELNLEPAPETELEADNKNVKDRTKRKMKFKTMPPVVPQENRQPLPRSRTGRIIRPPNRIMNDFKRLRTNDDSDHEEWVDNIDEVDSSNGRVFINQSQERNEDIKQEIKNESKSNLETLQRDNTNKEIPKKSKHRYHSKHICPTCNKVYLGYGKMKQHLNKYPDHGELDKMGLEPPRSKAKMKKQSQKGSQDLNGQTGHDIETNIANDNAKNLIGENVICTKSLFDCLMLKLKDSHGSQKWDILCQKLTEFVRDVQKYINSDIIADNLQNNCDVKGNIKVKIDDIISRILDIKPGQYPARKSFFFNEEDIHSQKNENTLSSSSPMKNVITHSFSSMHEMKQLAGPVDNIDIEMLCSSNTDFAKKVLSNPRSELQRQMDILINEDACANLPSLPEADNARSSSTLENLNGIRDNTPLNSEDGIAYQNVDDLVHESLKNLTADEIAAVPPLEHSGDDLVTSQSSLQDLSLDLFQFHHN